VDEGVARERRSIFLTLQIDALSVDGTGGNSK
jgi:hypothetical protein